MSTTFGPKIQPSANQQGCKYFQSTIAIKHRFYVQMNIVRKIMMSSLRDVIIMQRHYKKTIWRHKQDIEGVRRKYVVVIFRTAPLCKSRSKMTVEWAKNNHKSYAKFAQQILKDSWKTNDHGQLKDSKVYTYFRYSNVLIKQQNLEQFCQKMTMVSV